MIDLYFLAVVLVLPFSVILGVLIGMRYAK